MNTEMVAISKLKVAAYNPRVMPSEEMANLMGSIKEYGLVQPIVARREDGEIAGGHQRLEALIRLMREDGKEDDAILNTEVPVIYVDGFNDAKLRGLNLALNKIHGEWDFDKLNVVFSEIASLQPVEATVTGFSESEIADIMSLTTASTAPEVTEDFNVDAAVSAKARRLVFDLETDEELAAVTASLRAFGMTGPKNTSAALVRALATAAEHAPTLPVEEPPKRKRGKKDANDDHKASGD